MSKAILVLDMPECCLDCPCSFTYANVKGTITHDVCEAAEDRRLSKENMNEEKPMWCPLKQLPLKELPFYKTLEQAEYIRGRNEVINEILRGEE